MKTADEAPTNGGTLMRGFLNSARALAKPMSASIVNQLVSSGTGFLLGVYLVVALGPEQFGIYGIAFAATLLVGSVCNALVTTQMVVNLPEVTPEGRQAYAMRMLFLLCVVLIIGVALACAAIVLASFIGASQTQLSVATATAVACGGYALRDYFVRYAYSCRNEVEAMLINIAVALTTAAMFFVLHALRVKLDGPLAIMVYGAGLLGGAVLGLLRARLPLKLIELRSLRRDAEHAYGGGAWSLVGALVIWLQSQAYLYVTAMLLGPVGVGYANAAKLFIAPVQALMPAVSQMLLPRLATMRVERPEAVVLSCKWYAAIGLVLAVGYSAFLLLAYSGLERMINESRYQGLGLLVAAWACVLLIQVVRDAGSSAMQAMRRFQEVAGANAITAAVAIASGYWLCAKFGAAGSILGVAVGEAMLAALLWRLLAARKPVLSSMQRGG